LKSKHVSSESCTLPAATLTDVDIKLDDGHDGDDSEILSTANATTDKQPSVSPNCSSPTTGSSHSTDVTRAECTAHEKLLVGFIYFYLLLLLLC